MPVNFNNFATSTSILDTDVFVGFNNISLGGERKWVFSDIRASLITGAASTVTTSNLTVSRALASDASGKISASTITATELGYLTGVTSSIQTQLNAIGSGIPTGTVIYRASTSAPSGWIECNGAAITIAMGASYTALRNLLIAGGNPFGVSGGDPKIPDLRGKFIRSSGSDGTYSSAIFGTTQADALQNITGKLGVVGNQPASGFGGSSSGALFSSDFLNAGGAGGGGTAGNAGYINFNASLVARTSTETRPVNIPLLACIKL